MLLIAYALSASLAIAAHLAWPTAWALYAVLKTLTTLLVIRHAWRRGGPAGGRRLPLLAGLLLSLVGDVALLWPQQGFLPGLVAFLFAHLAYLFTFTRGVRLGAWPLAVVAYALLAAAVLSLLWPGVPGALRLPVLAYVLCLAAMAAQIASAWHASQARGDAPDAAATRRRLRGAARRWVVRCLWPATPCWRPTGSTARCRWQRCGSWPATGRRSG